jgi:DNA-binding MarR family transcriptional regulator
VLTDAGRTAHEKGRRIQEQSERDLFGALTESESATLQTLLAKLKA